MCEDGAFVEVVLWIPKGERASTLPPIEVTIDAADVVKPLTIDLKAAIISTESLRAVLLDAWARSTNQT